MVPKVGYPDKAIKKQCFRPPEQSYNPGKICTLPSKSQLYKKLTKCERILVVALALYEHVHYYSITTNESTNNNKQTESMAGKGERKKISDCSMESGFLSEDIGARRCCVATPILPPDTTPSPTRTPSPNPRPTRTPSPNPRPTLGQRFGPWLNQRRRQRTETTSDSGELNF